MKKLMLLPAVFLTCLFSLAVAPTSASGDRLPQPCFPLFGIGCPGEHSCNEETFLCPSQCTDLTVTAQQTVAALKRESAASRSVDG